jgi:ParB-like nuclease domain
MDEVGTASPIEVVWVDPFTERTPRKSKTWFDLRGQYLSWKVELEMANVEVPLAQIERNEKDGGKWRWDTPLFDSEVDKLIEEIKLSGKFEAVWLQKNGETVSILDGHHRVTAWKKMGNETIPAVVVTVKPRNPVYL